jgi:hypothetical protein
VGTQTRTTPLVAAAVGVALLVAALPLGLIFLGAQAEDTQQKQCAQSGYTSNQPDPSFTAQLSIPTDWLAILRSAARDYGVPWTVLAGIARIESDFGRSSAPGVHSAANSAGAAGPMQIGIGGAAGPTWQSLSDLPVADVYQPRYAVPVAAKYIARGLASSHGDIRAAIFTYNHATWYVADVLQHAREYGDGNFTVTAAAAACSAGAGGSGPTGPLAKGTRPFDGHPVAAWIVPILAWAVDHGWAGQVTSGYRTPAEQLAAAQHYGLEHYPEGPLASNHVRVGYPGGAVDVTLAAQLNEILKRYPDTPTLVWAGPTIGDWVHFSANGH